MINFTFLFIYAIICNYLGGKMNNLILVNKDNPININYVPNDLVMTDRNLFNFHGYLDPKHKPRVSHRVYLAFLKLSKCALEEEKLKIIIDSGYRSSDYQNKIWYYNLKNNYKQAKKNKLTDLESLKYAYERTNSLVALPGQSEHQTGLAIDIACYRNGFYSSKISDSKESAWMSENAQRFGFILRYPKGKEDITKYNYEPWHYRYVGYPESLDFYNGQWLTLEEYLEDKKLILH